MATKQRKKVIMANKITIKVKKLAFYNGALVYPNEIIKNFKGDSIPLWATLASGKEAPEVKKDETPSNPDGNFVNNPPNNETNNNGTEDVVAGDGGVHEIPSDDETEKEGGADETSFDKTEAEIMEEYNTLLDEAVEKNILLEDADKKTITEQIAELKTLLGKE